MNENNFVIENLLSYFFTNIFSDKVEHTYENNNGFGWYN